MVLKTKNKNYNWSIFWIKNKLQEKPSTLKREHPALQNMKFLNFFLFLWVIFALLDPDPDPESGSTDLIESRSGSETLVSWIWNYLFRIKNLPCICMSCHIGFWSYSKAFRIRLVTQNLDSYEKYTHIIVLNRAAAFIRKLYAINY